MKRRSAMILIASVLAVTSMGARKCGEGLTRWFSTNPAPDVRGDWNITYDNNISVEIDIGGQVHTGEISGESGTVTFTHDGNEINLNLDCGRPWIYCPSELWTHQVTLEQRNFRERPHQVHMTVNSIGCRGDLRMPDEDADECDSGDPKRPCDVAICDDPVEETKTTIGTISDPGDTSETHPPFDIEIALGGDFAVPTPNCVLVSWSSAAADIVYSGDYDVDATEPTMTASQFEDGVITTGYAGACFWFEDTTYTEEVRAVLLGATVRLRTGFTAVKAN